MKARCSGWSLSIVPRPSSVVIAAFAATDTGTEQERADLPSSSTVQAPHWASPQPNFGPFSSRSLRRTYRSGVSGATEDTRRVAPFTRNVKSAMISSGQGLCACSARRRRALPRSNARGRGDSPRLQRKRAVAHEREREADDRPEQRILVAAALGGEHPAVAHVAQIGREEQVNPEKDRNPSRIDPEDERQSAERLVDHDGPGEPVRKPQGREILSGARHPENHGLEVKTMQNEQDAHAHAQQQRSVRCSQCIDHLSPFPTSDREPAGCSGTTRACAALRRGSRLRPRPAWCAPDGPRAPRRRARLPAPYRGSLPSIPPW